MTELSLNEASAARLARTALGHVTREFPHKLDHVMGSSGDLRGPRDLHPVFFGSFDWHSCVHGWWTLFTLRRWFPNMDEGPAIAGLAQSLFTEDALGREAAYAAAPQNRGFERPYGWAWALMLAAELARDTSPEGGRRSAAFAPLAKVFVERFKAFLPIATYPMRVGTHPNTAFALRLTLDYADVVGDAELSALCTDAAQRWYGRDEAAQAWEPSQDEFLSSTLMEAACMARTLPPGAFHAWFDRFLPTVGHGTPATLFTPPFVSDRTDGKIVHLDGLCLSRAWNWFEIAHALPTGDSRCAVVREAAERHLRAAMPHVTGDYMGEHWLASFALLALLARGV